MNNTTWIALKREQSFIGAVKIGVRNLYHGCCHDFLYEKSSEILSALFKSVFFILQANILMKG